MIVAKAERPEPRIEKEMESRGIRVLWARTINAVAGLLSSVLDKAVIITELALRDGNWRDLVETVRCRSIPVLLLSSTSTAELWWDALECGVEDILPSPLSASRVCEYLEDEPTIQK